MQDVRTQANAVTANLIRWFALEPSTSHKYFREGLGNEELAGEVLSRLLSYMAGDGSDSPFDSPSPTLESFLEKLNVGATISTRDQSVPLVGFFSPGASNVGGDDEGDQLESEDAGDEVDDLEEGAGAGVAADTPSPVV